MSFPDLSEIVSCFVFFVLDRRMMHKHRQLYQSCHSHIWSVLKEVGILGILSHPNFKTLSNSFIKIANDLLCFLYVALADKIRMDQSTTGRVPPSLQQRLLGYDQQSQPSLLDHSPESRRSTA